MKENNRPVPTIEIQAESQRNALLARLQEYGVKPAQLERVRCLFVNLSPEEVIINTRVWMQVLNSEQHLNGDLINRVSNIANLSENERRKYLIRCNASSRRKDGRGGKW